MSGRCNASWTAMLYGEAAAVVEAEGETVLLVGFVQFRPEQNILKFNNP